MATVRKAATALCLLALAGSAGCGDGPTDDTRGYTKAPLEDPGVFISPEAPTVMDALGDPDDLALPRDPEEEETEGGPADD